MPWFVQQQCCSSIKTSSFVVLLGCNVPQILIAMVEALLLLISLSRPQAFKPKRLNPEKAVTTQRRFLSPPPAPTVGSCKPYIR